MKTKQLVILLLVCLVTGIKQVKNKRRNNRKSNSMLDSIKVKKIVGNSEADKHLKIRLKKDEENSTDFDTETLKTTDE